MTDVELVKSSSMKKVEAIEHIHAVRVRVEFISCINERNIKQ